MRRRLLVLCFALLPCACGAESGADGDDDAGAAADSGAATDTGPPAKPCSCDPKDDTICAVNTCGSDGKCALKARNNGAPCVDDDPCTVDDVCKAGSCTAGAANRCECQQTADCAALEDGNKCNGTMFCDTGVFPFRCRHLPNSEVICTDDGDPCTTTTCDIKKGECVEGDADDGTGCNDGDDCTNGDACKAGKCASGSVNTCTCTSTADCPDDGDLCNGVSFCDKGETPPVCKVNPATKVKCPTVDDTACTKSMCAPKTGLCAPKAVVPGTPCDDGDKCTSGEICVGGECQGGQNTCLCKSNADCAGKDDGDVCNGTL